MLKDQLMYPATLFLNNFDKTKQEFSVSMVASGYLDRQKIEPLLVYNVEQVFRSSSYDDFGAAYQKAFYDSTLEDKLKKVKWMTLQEALGSPVPKKKKTLVFIHTEWCNSCKVMQRATFIDTLVHAYMEKHFELTGMNAQDTVTLKFKDRVFVNERTPQAPFHQLAIALCRNNMILPSLAILDENMNLLDAVSFYIHPKFLDDILHFYGEDIYKTMSWKDFMTEKQQYFQGKGALAPKK
jgi:thioredoxin-related protein